jgi:hypothetical protein
MRLGSMPGIWLINEGLIPLRVLLGESGGAAEVSETGLFRKFGISEFLTTLRVCKVA